MKMGRRIRRIMHSARGLRIILIGCALILALSILVVAERATAPINKGGECIPKNLQVTDSSCIFLEYAKTEDARMRGLGGREFMPADHGMLFVFNDSAVRCFWMKDMRFSIDIVWLEQNGTITAKQSNVSPDTYPENFCPENSATYVIEVNAGVAKNWDVGMVVPLRVQ